MAHAALDRFEPRRRALIDAQYPDKMLAYNNSPSFNWKRHLDDAIAKYQRELGAMAGSTESEQSA